MQNQQLAQESDSLWQVVEQGQREKELHLQTASLLLPSFKLKPPWQLNAIFLVVQNAIYLYKETLTKLKEPSLWTGLLECTVWMSAFVFSIKDIFKSSSILYCKHFFFSGCTVGNSGELTTLWLASSIFCHCPYFLLPLRKLRGGSRCYFIEWNLWVHRKFY